MPIEEEDLKELNRQLAKKERQEVRPITTPEQPKGDYLDIGVYGTLKQGYSRHIYLGEEKFFKGDAFAPGILIHCGAYPALCEYPEDYKHKEFKKGNLVQIEVWSIHNKHLSRLDEIEGHPNFFHRKLVEIEKDKPPVWVYYGDPKRWLTGEQKVIIRSVWQGPHDSPCALIDFNDGSEKIRVKGLYRDNNKKEDKGETAIVVLPAPSEVDVSTIPKVEYGDLSTNWLPESRITKYCHKVSGEEYGWCNKHNRWLPIQIAWTAEKQRAEGARQREMTEKEREKKLQEEEEKWYRENQPSIITLTPSSALKKDALPNVKSL